MYWRLIRYYAKSKQFQYSQGAEEEGWRCGGSVGEDWVGRGSAATSCKPIVSTGAGRERYSKIVAEQGGKNGHKFTAACSFRLAVNVRYILSLLWDQSGRMSAL